MLTNEKQKTLSWQIRTKEGMYYQPDSLSIVYQWIIENRISADDLIFSAKGGDWVPIINMPELKNCFWQLLTNANIVYGPISLGEMKQLYVNREISSIDKVSVFGKEGWIRIDGLPMLNEWLKSPKVPEIDFVMFIEKLEKEVELSQKAPKEVKITRKIEEIKKQNLENIKYIKELETTKMQIGEELENTNKEKGKILSERVQLDSKLQTAEAQIKNLQSALQEKQALIEELNKHIAQTEVTATLKDDQVNQLNSSITSLQEELEKTKKENTGLQQSFPEVIKDLKGEIEELYSKNKKLDIDMNDLQGIISEKERLLAESNNKINEFIQKNEEIGDRIRLLEDSKSVLTNQLQSALDIKESEIADLQKQILEGEKEIDGYRESIVRMQSELAENNREMAGVEELNNAIVEKERILTELRTENDRFKEEVKTREDTISELKNSLEVLKEEYTAKIKEWEEAVVIQKKEFQNELSEKVRQLENVLKDEREKWEGARQDLEGNLAQKDAQLESQQLEIGRLKDAIISQDEEWKEKFRNLKEYGEKILKDEREKWEGARQDLEGNLAQKDAQLESQQLEIGRLKDAIISQDEEWQERFKAAKEEAEHAYKELERERDDLRIELTQRIDEIVSERDALQGKYADLENIYKGIVQDKEVLQKELLSREKFIESIKNEARNKEELHEGQIKEIGERLLGANKEMEGLQGKINELNNQLQKEFETQEGLRIDISKANNDLASTKLELEDNKSQFNETHSRLEHEIEEAKQNLEHAEEENRSLQKQFYLEKQKLTKEYNETINKLDKLQKRGQLEREIQDRARMKEELERLYNLMKENFSGLQRGAEEVQSSLQTLTSDIDNKRLSLKYLTETEKRTEKKGPFSKTEPAEES